MYSNFIVTCKKLDKVHYVKDSQLDNSKMVKLIKHISNFDINDTK